jgi:hypothetical protein
MCSLLPTCYLESLICASLSTTEVQPVCNQRGLGNGTHLPKGMVLVNGTYNISKEFRVLFLDRLSF